jgi:hypothetical protein
MAEQPKGPVSYFSAIEKKYGRPIAEWQELIASSGVSGHAALVAWLKSGYDMGHGHANALAAYFLNPGKWPEYRPEN